MPYVRSARVHPLASDADTARHAVVCAARGGVLVVHQRTPIAGEAPTKYHGRDCRHVAHRVFLDGAAQGKGNADWFTRARRAIRGSGRCEAVPALRRFLTN